MSSMSPLVSSLLAATNGPVVLVDNAAECPLSSIMSVLPWDVVVTLELDTSSIRLGGSGSESESDFGSQISSRVVGFHVTVPGASCVPANAPVAVRISASARGGGGCLRRWGLAEACLFC